MNTFGVEWQETVKAEGRRTSEILLSQGDSDEAVEAALQFWIMLEDPGRQEFLRWCCRHVFSIGRRPFGRVLAASWMRPKTGSLVSWGFDARHLTLMFSLTPPEYLMEQDDLATYNDLPAEIVAYRGCAGIPISKARYGMSWTLDRDKAIWFAKRAMNGVHQEATPICLRATVHKGNVLAYFDNRNEREIVVATGRVSRVALVASGARGSIVARQLGEVRS